MDTKTIDASSDIVDQDTESDEYLVKVSDDKDIQDFFSTNIDTILDIYYDLKEILAFNPYFLGKCKSTDLTDFFINCLYHKAQYTFDFNETRSRTDYTTKSMHIEKFTSEYCNELNVSHIMVSYFLKRFHFTLDLPTWTSFCMAHSDLCEIILSFKNL